MIRQSTSSKEMSGGCLSLFGLPFLVAGLFLAGLYFHGYVQWWRAQGWQEVPCRIESAELVSGGKSSRATAVYHYQFEGRAYRGDRVSIHGGSDNIGSFQQDAHRELRAHVAGKPPLPEAESSGKPGKVFRCFVNPANPSESVLYRTLRWPMQAFLAVFSLIFPAVGAGFVAGGLLAMRQKKREAELRNRHPSERWKWKSVWAETSIPEESTAAAKALYAYTFWFWLIVTPLLLSMLALGAFSHDRVAWLGLIFPMIGLIPGWFTLKRIRHRIAAGKVRFEMKNPPAQPGGILHGVILLGRPLPARGTAEVSLECGKSIRTRSGNKSTQVITEKIWSHRQNISTDLVTRDLAGFRLPVSVVLPADAPESTPDDSGEKQYQWKLHFMIPGTPVHSTFEIPVFHTGAKPAQPDRTTATLSIHEATASDLPTLLASRRIRASFDANGLPQSIVCPPRAHPPLILFFTIFNLIWTAAAVFLIYQNAPLIFRLIWPLSAVVIWCSVIWMCFYKRTVTFDGSGLIASHQLGPVLWTRSFTKQEIVSFSYGTNMSSGNQSFYQVQLASVIGKKETLASNITESATAAALVRRLEEWKKPAA